MRNFGELWLAVGALSLGCATTVAPPPRAAARQLADAASRTDAPALRALLDKEGRRTLTEAELRRILADSADELRRRGERFASADARVSINAVLRMAGGQQVELVIEDGRYHVRSALALPAAAVTPQLALAQLQAALSRRSYDSLLQVLSRRARAELDGQMDALATALEHVESLEVVIDGHRATVTTSDGHRVELEQEDGIWKIQDFE